MEAPKIFQDSVRTILKEYPEVTSAFIQLRAQCVGCAFGRFCTLEDVSRYYGIQLNDLRDLLLEKISETPYWEKE